jgi:hypothetical protein
VEHIIQTLGSAKRRRTSPQSIRAHRFGVPYREGVMNPWTNIFWNIPFDGITNLIPIIVQGIAWAHKFRWFTSMACGICLVVAKGFLDDLEPHRTTWSRLRTVPSRVPISDVGLFDRGLSNYSQASITSLRGTTHTYYDATCGYFNLTTLWQPQCTAKAHKTVLCIVFLLGAILVLNRGFGFV